MSVADRFEIFEQLQRYQRCIDNDASRASAMESVDLHWPEGKFTVRDLRHNAFEGPEGSKRRYDYAHSVFPLHSSSTPSAASTSAARATPPTLPGGGS